MTMVFLNPHPTTGQQLLEEALAQLRTVTHERDHALEMYYEARAKLAAIREALR